jgi:hypothetical protein
VSVSRVVDFGPSRTGWVAALLRLMMMRWPSGEAPVCRKLPTISRCGLDIEQIDARIACPNSI